MASKNSDPDPAGSVISDARRQTLGNADVRDRQAKKPTGWLRWIGFGVLAVVGLIAFLLIIGLLARGKIHDATIILRRASTDPGFAASGGISGKFVEAGYEAPVPPLGAKANFYWSSRPTGADVEITTFDTAAHAMAAFDLFADDNRRSLLMPPAEGEVSTTVYENFSKGRIDRKAEKIYRCAQREHAYACGSIPAGVPAIVVIRLPLEADWHGPSSGDVEKDPMAAMERAFAKTNTVAAETGQVEQTLGRIGLGEPRSKP